MSNSSATFGNLFFTEKNLQKNWALLYFKNIFVSERNIGALISKSHCHLKNYFLIRSQYKVLVAPTYRIRYEYNKSKAWVNIHSYTQNAKKRNYSKATLAK